MILPHISEILDREECNTGRQYNLDLLKALAIICMIVCHSVIMLGQHRPDYASEFLYSFADNILGSYIAVAHAFMFCMGVGFVYTRHKAPADHIKRGIRTYILAYVLNFLRYGIYAIIGGMIDPAYRAEIPWAIYVPDILQFAGLAMILTGVFKKLNLDVRKTVFIAVIMAAAGGILAFTFQGSVWENLLVGTFISTTEKESAFALFNWYIFVAVGMLFGESLRRIKNPDHFYKKLLTGSAVVMILYITLTCKFGMFFLCKDHSYYATSLLEDCGLLSIDFFILSVFHFLLKCIPVVKLRCFIIMSRCVNTIYCIHWCILGAVESFCCYLFGLVFGYGFCYLFGVLLIIVSTLLAVCWKNRKKRGC